MKYCLLLVMMIFSLAFFGCSDDEESSSGPVNLDSDNYLVIAGKYSLSLFDLDESKLIETDFGLGNAPNWVIPDENRLYVISSLSNDLQYFEFVDNELTFVKSVDLGLGYNRNPYAAALTNDGRLLITNLLNNTVSVLNTESFEIEETWDTGVCPEGIIVQGNLAYVINTGFDYDDLSYHNGSLYCFDINTGALEDTVDLGINPQFGAFDSFGRIHITCTGNYDDVLGSVWVVNTSPLYVMDHFAVNGYPGRIAINNTGKAYIASGGWYSSGDDNGLVISYNSNDFSELSYLSVGYGALDVFSLTQDSQVIVACQDARTIEFLEGNSITKTYSLSDYPQALGIWHIDHPEYE